MDYTQLAFDVVQRVQATGADAEAFIGVGYQTNIQVARGEVERFSNAGIKGLGVRALRNGQMGYAYTSDFAPESVARTIENALELSSVATPDVHRILPEVQPMPEDDLEIYDPAVGQKSMEAKIAFAKEMEAAALAADERVKLTDRTTYFDGTARYYLVNSNGFSGSYEKSFVYGYLRAVAMDENERAWAHGGDGSPFSDDLDASRIGSEVGETAARLLGGEPVPTQEAIVVYAPVAAADFLGVLARALTADAMQRNRSFLQGKMGQTVASDMVTVVDSGRLRRGMASRPFDDEGTPTDITCLINEGVLQAVLHDSYTAHKDSTRSTGNANRPFHYRPPMLSHSNFFLRPGTQTPEEIIADVWQGLYVVDAVTSGSTNPISGDYSVAARGFWIEDGRLSFPVNGVTIALPLEQLLQNIRVVGNDLEFQVRPIGSPTIRVDGVILGGRT